tara:strand:+ start:15319 stop:15789 length:471 start_codon:yes stop_codon:yes gene_type:complete
MKKLLYIATCFFLFGCQNIEKPEKPDNLIPEDTMAEILVEVYLGNAARRVDNRAMREKGVKIDSFLFKKYSIDSLQFAKSNAYYASDLDTYNAIFQKIEQKLEAFKAIENEKRLRVDSLKTETKKARNLKEEETELDTTKTETEGVLIDSAISEQN